MLSSTPKIACLVPTYRRNEYTEKCLAALFRANEGPVTAYIYQHPGDGGLRNAIIDFFEHAKRTFCDIICKVDNDCIVPENWLTDIIKVFEETDVDVLSPNVFPSNAADRFGVKVEGLPYMPSKIVGGLWCMRTELIKDMQFQRHDTLGLTGAIAILRQIIIEKEPKVGWVPQVVVQDLGHWSGEHPDCIKTREHEEYYAEVGREISWSL